MIDEAVAASEQRTGFRNIALANYMKSFGVLDNPVDLTLGVYFHHCAIAMSCRQLAWPGASSRIPAAIPSTGHSVVSPERARRINAVMLTCGHYDGSGEFAYRVGLPGKSGVGGGILAIAPGKASIAVWSPGLDAAGNSHLGRIALEMLTKRLGWSIFGHDARLAHPVRRAGSGNGPIFEFASLVRFFLDRSRFVIPGCRRWRSLAEPARVRSSTAVRSRRSPGRPRRIRGLRREMIYLRRLAMDNSSSLSFSS